MSYEVVIEFTFITTRQKLNELNLHHNAVAKSCEDKYPKTKGNSLIRGKA